MQKISCLTVEVSADTSKLVAKYRAVATHLSAVADELQNIDGKDDSEAKACEIITLLNEINSRDLEQITQYADGLLSDVKSRDMRKGTKG